MWSSHSTQSFCRAIVFARSERSHSARAKRSFSRIRLLSCFLSFLLWLRFVIASYLSLELTILCFALPCFLLCFCLRLLSCFLSLSLLLGCGAAFPSVLPISVLVRPAGTPSNSLCLAAAPLVFFLASVS